MAARVATLRWMRRDTLLDFFADFDENTGRFLIYDDGFRSETFRYGEVVRRAREFAAWLRGEGFQAGDKVVLYSENRPEWVIALWGCLLEGVIVVPVDFRSPLDFVRRVCQITAARLVLAGAEAPPPTMTAFAAGVRVLPLVSLAGSPGRPEAGPAAITPETTAEIIFTSGATSDPKGVLISHSNILANVVPVEREVRKHRKWAWPFFPLRFLNLLPLSHMFGQAMATFIPPMLAGEVIFMRGYNPAEILRQIRTRRISVLVSVPMILEVLREHILQRFPDLRTNPPTGAGKWYRRWWKHRRVHNAFGWKFWTFIVGAAPLAPDVETFWANLGFLVIQGYGLTETAPIVTLNHPFHASKGTVGKPIGGVEVKIAADGEILVRGANVTKGYYNADAETERAFDAEGWFHTGDIGTMDQRGQLAIIGRKKEMIVTPEGLNVFPEDVERVLLSLPGVRDAAVIGTDRVHAVLLLHSGAEAGADAADIVRQANARLADHQKIHSASLWPWPEFPRTEGTRKLKRHEIARGAAPPPRAEQQRFASDTPLDALSSLERVELMVTLDVEEATLAEASTVGDLRSKAEHQAAVPAPVTFPSWNRSWWARAVRRIALPSILLPLARLFAWIRVSGRENLHGLRGPVIFAPNHQSHMDVPVLMAAAGAPWRYRMAPAMARDFFHAHFHPREHRWREWFTNSLNYYLAALVFNAFPIPRRESGALETMRYIGEITDLGNCLVIFPEGRLTDRGEIAPFQPGVGMLASRLTVPVVPVRIEGLDRVLHKSWRMARPGRVRVAIGKPLHLAGDDYAALARQVEEAVRSLQ
jgi:long-chain acyl-CoA synthetase